jgi:hypothetical protein
LLGGRGPHGCGRSSRTPSTSPMTAAYMRARERAEQIPLAAGISAAWAARSFQPIGGSVNVRARVVSDVGSRKAWIICLATSGRVLMSNPGAGAIGAGRMNG